ncbi:MAG: hypothetical protein Q8O67_18045 [Deltaproteobacteria bacterium]|nr:hypothetical protein [Deltaproteobacteria bacterium]
MLPLRPLLCFVIACVALAIPIVIVDVAPSGDGPQHLLVARAVANYDDDALGYARFVEPQLPPSAEAFAEVLIALLTVLPWKAAYAAGLLLVLWGWTAAVAILGRALKRPAWGVVVGVVTAYSWCFYLGLLPYCMATAIGLLAIALAVSTTTWTPRHVALLAFLLLACAHAHVFAAVLVGPVVLAIAARSEARRRAVVAVVVAGLPALALSLFVATRDAPVVGSWVNSDLLERASVVAWGFIGGPAWRAWPPVVVAVVGLVHGLRAGKCERSLAFAAGGLVVLAWLLPRDAPGWQLVSPRPLLLGMTLLLLLAEPARIIGSLRARTSVAVVVVVATLAWSAAFHLRFHAAIADLRAHLEEPPAHPGLRFPVVFAPASMPPGSDVRFLNPFFNVGQLVAVAHGGWTAFTFSHLPIHMVRERRGMPPDPDRSLVTRMWLRDDDDKAAAFADLISNARRYDSVVAFEDAADHERWIARGFAPDVREGHLQVLRFVGCRASVRVPAGVAVVENGFTPHSDRGATRRQRVSAGADVVDVTGLGCGPVWLRLLDAAGQPVPCAGVETLEVTASRDGPLALECAPQK